MSWLDKWGFLLGGSALVLSSEAPTIWKAVAKTAKWGFGDRIQVCDGTDDNIEIQAAINALSASGGKLILSEGNYSVSSVVQGISDLEIELLPGAKIALAVGATCRIFETTSTQNVSIHGGELEGTNNSTVSNELVYFRYCTGVHLGPIKLHDCYGNAFAVSGCEHVTLDVFTDTTRGVGHGGGLIEGCKYVSGVVHVKDTADSGADINGTAEYPSEHL
ncbi:MAG: hypothetical protein SVP26_08935, partial [Chloroflexota bacterium]|nr:hypothetical protein [Chloroflexota bacterium]